MSIVVTFFLIAKPSSVLAQMCSGNVVGWGIQCDQLVISGCDAITNYNPFGLCPPPKIMSRQWTGCTSAPGCGGNPENLWACNWSDHCDDPPDISCNGNPSCCTAGPGCQTSCQSGGGTYYSSTSNCSGNAMCCYPPGPTSPPQPTSPPASPGCTITNSSGTSVFTLNSSGSFSTTPVNGAVYAALAYTPPGGSPTALCSEPVALPGYNVCPRSINFTSLGTYTLWCAAYNSTGGQICAATGNCQTTTVSVVAPIPTPTTCVAPSVPGGLTTTSLGNGQYRLAWGTVANASTYPLRIDSLAPSWTGACPASSPDVCTDSLATNFYTFTPPSGSHSWWVHSANACGWSSNSPIQSFTVPLPTSTPLPTPTPAGLIQGYLYIETGADNIISGSEKCLPYSVTTNGISIVATNTTTGQKYTANPEYTGGTVGDFCPISKYKINVPPGTYAVTILASDLTNLSTYGYTLTNYESPQGTGQVIPGNNTVQVSVP